GDPADRGQLGWEFVLRRNACRRSIRWNLFGFWWFGTAQQGRGDHYPDHNDHFDRDETPQRSPGVRWWLGRTSLQPRNDPHTVGQADQTQRDRQDKFE